MGSMLERLRESELSTEELQNMLSYLDELTSYVMNTIESLSKLLIEEGSSDEMEAFMEHILKDMKYSIGDEVENLTVTLKVIGLATDELKKLAPIENGNVEKGSPELSLKGTL